jgi:rRNA-processing protein FCF1
MKKIYFDNNIIIDIKNLRNKALQEKVEQINKKEYQIVFSPAHIEEIAAIVKHYGQDDKNAKDKLSFLAQLTDSTALLPFPRNKSRLIQHDGIFIYKEHPKKTYSRVIDQYKNNAIAEHHQKEKLKHGEDFEAEHGISSKETNNIDIIREIDFFKPRLHQIIIDNYHLLRNFELGRFLPDSCPGCDDLNFAYTKNYFTIHEAIMEKLLEFLEVRRFFPDNPKNSINSLHDTTHAIYGAYCDIFVTNDKKLKQKTSAAYQWLGINTNIFNSNEFIEYLSKQHDKV